MVYSREAWKSSKCANIFVSGQMCMLGGSVLMYLWGCGFSNTLLCSRATVLKAASSLPSLSLSEMIEDGNMRWHGWRLCAGLCGISLRLCALTPFLRPNKPWICHRQLPGFTQPAEGGRVNNSWQDPSTSTSLATEKISSGDYKFQIRW